VGVTGKGNTTMNLQDGLSGTPYVQILEELNVAFHSTKAVLCQVGAL